MMESTESSQVFIKKVEKEPTPQPNPYIPQKSQPKILENPKPIMILEGLVKQ